MKVLIIEPDVLLAKACRKIFEQEGIETNLCHDAGLAMLDIDQQKPDCIVLEIQLAEHSGIEFLHEIRSYQDLQGIPVYLYSGVPLDRFENSKQSLVSLNIKRILYKSKTNLKQLAGIIKSDFDTK